MMTPAVAMAIDGMDARARVGHVAGDLVTVGPAYRMGGSFVPDGIEGTWVVVERCSQSPTTGTTDYLLRNAHGVEMYVPASRISPLK